MAKLGKFSNAELIRYKERVEEFSTVDARYCSNTTCGRFTPLACLDNGNLVCLFCSSRTCYGCGKAAHPDTLCDEVSKYFKNAKQCPGCKRGWEKIDGC